MTLNGQLSRLEADRSALAAFGGLSVESGQLRVV